MDSKPSEPAPAPKYEHPAVPHAGSTESPAVQNIAFPDVPGLLCLVKCSCLTPILDAEADQSSQPKPHTDSELASRIGALSKPDLPAEDLSEAALRARLEALRPKPKYTAEECKFSVVIGCLIIVVDESSLAERLGNLKADHQFQVILLCLNTTP